MTVEEQLKAAKDVMYEMLPAVGGHARGFSQEALARACYILGADPWDWTQHPDVLEGRISLLPKRMREKLERRKGDAKVLDRRKVQVKP